MRSHESAMRCNAMQDECGWVGTDIVWEANGGGETALPNKGNVTYKRLFDE